MNGVLFVTVKSFFFFFLFGNQDKDKHEPCKGSDKDKIQTTFLKSDIYDLF